VHTPEPQCVADVIDSVRTVGKETGTSEEAEVVAQSLEAGFQRIRDAVAGLPRPKVAFLEWTGTLLKCSKHSIIATAFICKIDVMYAAAANTSKHAHYHRLLSAFSLTTHSLVSSPLYFALASTLAMTS
jgi:ABC-type Fe3+-hydroxamate transport system substrate-binding protein